MIGSTRWGYIDEEYNIVAKKLKANILEVGLSKARLSARRTPRSPHGAGRRALAVDPDIKINNLHRLRRIEGQIRGLQKMVEGDRYCADILIQIASVQKSLQGVAMELWRNHLNYCVSHAIRAGGTQAEAAREELLQLLRLMNRG